MLNKNTFKKKLYNDDSSHKININNLRINFIK